MADRPRRERAVKPDKFAEYKRMREGGKREYKVRMALVGVFRCYSERL